MDEKSYLSGFADGEGCFSVTFNKSRRHKFGWDIRPSFSVSQNSEREEIVHKALALNPSARKKFPRTKIKI